MKNSINRNIDFLDGINILSFAMQVLNNEELRKQSTNDDVIKTLHNDIILLLEESKKNYNEILSQNKEILEILKGGVENE